MICLFFFIISAFESIIGNQRFTHLEFGVILISIAVASMLAYIDKSSLSNKAKAALFSTAIVLLIIDWAALHDIVSGEPNTTLESLILMGSIAIFMFFPLIPNITGDHK